MELADIFDLPDPFDPSARDPVTEALADRFRKASIDDPLRAGLADVNSVAWDAARLVSYAVHPSGAPIESA